MVDPNLKDFYGRVARIEKARSQGYGFEAEGTLGRSYYLRPSRTRKGVLAPMVVVLMCAFGLKGAIHYKIGGSIYQERVDTLMAGEGFERLGGYLMMADPVTVFVSDQIRTALAG